ncbi:hypothetical protein P3T76_003844 [Phytophthora citrophthora]|uniref:Uncharacterized protein n=1 Tax=Phytophthora citrophthora TaxID=4793 RepID=A0AAD9GVE5_9STRA|nr:hypothetical protein P3T76_003844 [Phytophthora citrophthora]
MKQIQLEAWHLINLHTLRCLENGLALPDFADKTFFDHCCSGVASTSKTNLIAQKNPDLWKSIVLYRSQRERAGLAEVEHKIGYSDLKSELREQMVVNAGAMIREHFRKRLRLYVQLRFGQIDDTMTKKQKADKKNLVNAILRACYNTEDTELVEALEMRDVLTPDGSEWREQWVPWPNHIKENGMAFYVRLLWEFLGVVECRMEEVPNEKGVRVFTLFPVSTTYTSAHITLNGSTLAGFYTRIADHSFRLPQIPVTPTSFKASRWEVMRHALGISRFETMKEGSPLTRVSLRNCPWRKICPHESPFCKPGDYRRLLRLRFAVQTKARLAAEV